ncbi:MAG: TetR family transcriptional regulator [Gemmatimonadota bacterium]
MKLPIVDHAKSLLVEQGLSNWTIDRVATRANCAKGLVTYHHGTRNALLGAVAAQLRDDRQGRRMSALHQSGSSAIDALWAVILSEQASGQAAAWLALLASTEPEIRNGRRPLAGDAAALGRLLVEALSLEADAAAVGGTSVAAIDGFAAALMQGFPTGEVRDAYHRFWLGLLG